MLGGTYGFRVARQEGEKILTTLRAARGAFFSVLDVPRVDHGACSDLTLNNGFCRPSSNRECIKRTLVFPNIMHFQYRLAALSHVELEQPLNGLPCQNISAPP